MAIGRGCTPTCTFTVAQDLSDCSVFVSFGQKDEALFTITGDDLDLSVTDGVTTITCVPTQAQTLLLNAKYKTGIQVRWVDAAGTAGKTNLIHTDTEPILLDGEITYGN